MTKREHMPISYDPRLDRRQPPALGCLKTVPILIAVAACALVLLIVGFRAALPQKAAAPIPTLAVLPSETSTSTVLPSPSPTPTLTLDSWALTGTALLYLTASPTFTASPTLDYCWWLTPTATASPTLAFTPDDWSATGTAQYESTHPPTTPTVAPPRELCTDRGEPTATFTPYPFPELFGSKAPTVEPTATDAPVTWTMSPVPPAAQSSGGGAAPAPQQAGPSAAPVIVQVTSIVVQQVVITATRRPETATPSKTITPTPSATSTPTTTDAPSATPTVTRDAAWWASATAYYQQLTPATATDSPVEPTVTFTAFPFPDLATATASDVPTDEPSATPTDSPSPTPTETATATDQPTDVPTDQPTLESPTDVPTDAPLTTEESSS